MNTEQERADFEAWLPKAYRQSQESYSVHNMEVAFVAGFDILPALKGRMSTKAP